MILGDEVQLPRVLVVSNLCISPAHGTGTLLLRHFSRYPVEKLANVYYRDGGSPSWPQSYCARVIQADSTPGGIIGKASLRVYNSATFRLRLRRFCFNKPFTIDSGVVPKLKGFGPEVIYSVSYGEAGLAMLDHLCAHLPRVPLIQYFLDYDEGAGFCRQRYLRRVLQRADGIWALTEEMAAAISPAAGKAGKPVRIQPGFHLELPDIWKQAHHAAGGPDFTCVVSGNFWQPAMATLLKRIWGRVQTEISGLGPIQWLCEPEMVKQTTNATGDLAPEIMPVGFFHGEALIQRLIASDLAIVPFNACAKPENDYGRYSLPSRLTELLSVGLPVFCIAGERTPLARYATRNNLAVVCNAQDEARLVQRLASFIRNLEERVAVGASARKFAEREFPLRPFQDFLFSKLITMADLSRL